MVKKISLIILSLAIVAAGIIGAIKLNYWQRSVSIFKVKSSEQQFGRGGFRNERPEFGRGEGMRDGMRRELPDSIRQRFEREGRPDSLFRRGRGMGDQRMGRDGYGRGPGEEGLTRGEGGFERGTRSEGRRGGDDFRGGKKINIETVVWFLAVFASLVVIVIYIEKAIKLIRKKKN